jgi:hypothetical protein
MDPEKPCPKPAWGESLKLMGGSDFLNTLLNFPKVKKMSFMNKNENILFLNRIRLMPKPWNYYNLIY